MFARVTSAWGLASLLWSQVALADDSEINAVQGSPSNSAPATLSAGSGFGVALSVSGAISLGAYQSGVNWALIQFLHHQSDPDPAQHFSFAKDDLGLSVLTGASAGSINALISALEYCAKEPTSAWDSQFFKVWQPVGLENLIPAVTSDYNDGDGLLARGKIDAVAKLLQEKLSSTEVRAGCRVPMGVVVTRARPFRRMVGRLQVPSSRASVMWAATARTDGKGLAFEQLAPLTRQPQTSSQDFGRYLGAVGERIFLPTDALGMLGSGQILDVLKASSAVQGAFAPIAIRTCIVDEDESSFEKCRLTEAETRVELFSDGGLFDSIPLGLAFGLDYQAETRARTFTYIDPDVRRPLVREDEQSGVDGTGTDLHSLSTMLEGFIAASRKAELGTVLHYWPERAAEPGKIVTSTRYHEVVGSHMGYFGAFWSRPFREHDYMVGVYDGLQFLVEQVCRDEAQSSWGKPVAIISRQRCENTMWNELLEKLGLSQTVGPACEKSDCEYPVQFASFVRFLLQEERRRSGQDPAPLRPWPDDSSAPAVPRDIPREVVERGCAEVRAKRRLLGPASRYCALGTAPRSQIVWRELGPRSLPETGEASPRDAASEKSQMTKVVSAVDAPHRAKSSEPEGLRWQMLKTTYHSLLPNPHVHLSASRDWVRDGLQEDGLLGVLTAVRQWASDALCPTYFGATECAELARWGKQPEAEARATIRRLISRQHMLESGTEGSGAQELVRLMSFAARQETLYSVGSENHDGSSAPHEWGWRYLVPYHVSGEMGRLGLTMGYRFESKCAWGHLCANFGANPVWLQLDTMDYQVAASGGLSVRTGWPWISKFDLNWAGRYRFDPNWEPQELAGISGVAYFLLDKFRLEVVAFKGDPKPTVLVGFADVPGLVSLVAGPP